MIENEALVRELNLPERARQKSFITHSVNATIDADSTAKTYWWIKKFFNKKRSSLIEHLSSYNVTLNDLPGLQDSALLKTSNSHQERSVLWRTRKPYSLPDMEAESWQAYGFENLCRPLLGYAQDQIEKTINSLNNRTLNADKKQILYDVDIFLRRRLASFINPTFVLEANLFRLKNSDSISDAEIRFRVFIDSFNVKENQKHFWNKYPALWRLISTVARNSVDACQETLQRVARDRNDLEKTLLINKKSKLRSINWGTGDAHCGGRVVALLHFEEGSLVYKPKDMTADKAYNDFVAWYSRNCDGLLLSNYPVLTRDKYGYKMFVEAKPCTSLDEVKAFYSKLGSLIALAWVLGITDLHHENIIASGSEPYLIDVEVMLSRPVRYRSKGRPTYQDSYSQVFHDSLLGTGMLPFRMLGPNGIYDISAIGARGEQAAPAKAMIFENTGRDDIQLTPQNIPLQQEQNVPMLNGVTQKSTDFIDEIIGGFEQAVCVFGKYKDYLLSDESILRAFTGVHVRHVARNTIEYAQLLQKMSHPTVLKDALECDMLIAGELRSSLDGAPHLAELIHDEVDELWDGDVPYFYTLPESRDLYSSKGKIFKGFFEKTGFDVQRERLDLLSKYRTHHISTIRSSINSNKPLGVQSSTSFNRKTRKEKISNDMILERAANIGEKILSETFYANKLPFWIGFTALEKTEYNVGIVPPTLYDGAPGIGLFFAYLYRYTRDARFREIALNSHKIIKNSLCSSRTNTSFSCGAFNGYSGLIYADLHLTSALGEPTAIQREDAFKKLKLLIESDENFDLVSGAAGALLIALKYYQKSNNPEALAAAEAAADRLAAAAEKQQVGVAWHTLKPEEKRIGGLSHGVSGIAWALSLWAAHTKEKKWKNLAQQAFAYEQSFYDKKTGLWIDARSGQPICLWCYGANGIGVAALNMTNTINREAREHILDVTKEATWKNGLMENHCLCHGNLGNSELYLLTEEYDKARIILANVLADYEAKHRWSCGLPGGDTTPGLMCGLAGIGYGLLRHAYPKEVPSILNLELPAL